MAFDERLENRIRATIDGLKNVSARKRFGGVWHLIQGNMIYRVNKHVLILHLGETAAADALSQTHLHAFDTRRRPMKGWVMVAPEGLETAASLNTWLKKPRSFALTLAPKRQRLRS